MCLHTKQTKKAQRVENRFNAEITDIDSFVPSNHFNGFSFPKTPIITNTHKNKIQLFNWGLLPEFATDDWNKTYTLNARYETLNEKIAFKEVVDNRCLIIVDGFYEWQQNGNTKSKFEIGFNNELFALAGLYTKRDDYYSYTIITTEAQGLMQEIHNTKLRMPIALTTDNQMNNWLNGDDVIPSIDFTTTPCLNYQRKLF